MISLSGISSMATRHVLKDLATATEAAGIARVDVTSIGGVTAAERVSAGEAFDLAILDQAALTKLADAGHVDPATVRPLVVSHVGVAVAGTSDDQSGRVSDDDGAEGDGAGAAGEADEADEAAPDLTVPAFPDAAGLAAALLASTGIGYSTGPSGKAVLTVIRELGIYADVADRLVQARPGVPVASLLASGDVSIGFQQVSEILGQPGIQLLGLLPPGLEISSTFSAAVTTACASPEVALQVLDFWGSPEAEAIKSSHHFTSNGASCEH